jgi:hypothetical protein
LRKSRVAQRHRKQLSLPVLQMANHRINSLVPAVVIADFCNKIGPKADSPGFMMGWTPRRRHRCAKVEVLSTT